VLLYLIFIFPLLFLHFFDIKILYYIHILIATSKTKNTYRFTLCNIFLVTFFTYYNIIVSIHSCCLNDEKEVDMTNTMVVISCRVNSTFIAQYKHLTQFEL